MFEQDVVTIMDDGESDAHRYVVDHLTFAVSFQSNLCKLTASGTSMFAR